MRGLAVIVITGMVALLGWLAFVLADYLLSLLPLGPMAGTVLALAIGLIVCLWIIGDRTILRTLGQMAKISDTDDC